MSPIIYAECFYAVFWSPSRAQRGDKTIRRVQTIFFKELGLSVFANGSARLTKQRPVSCAGFKAIETYFQNNPEGRYSGADESIDRANADCISRVEGPEKPVLKLHLVLKKLELSRQNPANYLFDKLRAFSQIQECIITIFNTFEVVQD